MTQATMPVPPHYDGDERFTQLLAKLDCPMPLHQIKTLLLGALAGTNMPRLDALFHEMWQGNEPTFETQEEAEAFAGSILGLLNSVAVRKGSTPLRLTPIDVPITAADIVRHGTIRTEEINGFMRGLELGGTTFDSLTADASDGVKILADGLHFLQASQDVTVRDSSATAESARELGRSLSDFDRVLEHAMARASRLGRQPGSIQQPLPGRNDPCPCGSGKKYKRCCGMN